MFTLGFIAFEKMKVLFIDELLIVLRPQAESHLGIYRSAKLYLVHRGSPVVSLKIIKKKYERNE